MYSFKLNEIIYVSKIDRDGIIVNISDDDVISINIDGEIKDFLPYEIVCNNEGCEK